MSHPAPPASAPRPAVPPHDLKAEELFQTGVQAHQAGELTKAAEFYNKALAQNPSHQQALNNLAVALRKLKKPEAAMAVYRRALALAGDRAGSSTLVNYGNVLRDLGRFEESRSSYRRAITLEPTNRGAWYGLGLVLRDLKEIDESIAALEQALTLTPDDPELHWDLSHSLLCKGDFKRGFAYYESRWQLPDVVRPCYPWPEWDGQSTLDGKTILLYGEQGFGDVLQCVRFVPLVVAKGAQVILHVRPELVSLLQGQFAGVTQVIAREITPPQGCCEVVAPLMSLPFLLGLEAADVPPAPYIKTPTTSVVFPSAIQEASLRVGVCWQGSPTHKNDHNRSMPFTELLPLLDFPSVALLSLQKGPAAQQPAEHGISSLITILDPALKSFAESAAILAHLDLLITVDTSVLHLAAAMGVPVWLLLPVSHDWRVDAQDSLKLWYSSVRVFKQPTAGDWASVMKSVHAALAERLGSVVQA